jgi:diadenosine tetraphosphate (Ap4A) HIT family hydrolase
MNKCVFCNFSSISQRTIATIEGFNIVATLGQITNGGYLLLIPINHSPCLGALSQQASQSLEQVFSQTVSVLEEEYGQPLTVFEHGIVGQTIHHSHLHLLPASFNLTPKIKRDFPKAETQPINGFQELRKSYTKKKQPYLFWSTPSGEQFVCWNPPATPEYFRIASAELLKVPERASWKKMDQLLDNQLAEDTLERLVPLFTF